MTNEDNQKEEEIDVKFDIRQKRKELLELWSDIFTIARGLVDDIKAGDSKVNASMLSTITTLLTKSTKILDDAEKNEAKGQEEKTFVNGDDGTYSDEDIEGVTDLAEATNLVNYYPDEFFEQFRHLSFPLETYSKCRQAGIELTLDESLKADEWDAMTEGHKLSMQKKQGQNLHGWQYQMVDAFEAGDPDPQDPRTTGKSVKSVIQDGADLQCDGLNFKRD